MKKKSEIQAACAVLFALSFLATPGHARQASREVTSTPDPEQVPIPRINDQTIILDGVLDEEVWSKAARFAGFYQYLPVDDRKAQDSTEVFVWYSPTAIHFGVRAFETHDAVRATLADRDRIDGDDHVYLVLDTYNDSRQAVLVGANPLGQQADGTLRDASRSGFQSNSTSYSIDLSPDFVYESKGRLTESGYEIEFRIPFKSLRYQTAEVQNWGFNVIRRIQHSGYASTWTRVLQSNASFMAQNGTIMELQGLSRGLVLDINPELTGTVNRDAGNGAPWDADARDPLGVNMRWGISNNLTLNGTVNPDFSQVEADVAQFQFDPRQAVYVPEKRPFFLDGIELFASPTNLIYTRRIANPLSAVKLTGKTGNTNVALLSAVDNKEIHLSDLDSRYFNAMRLRRDLSGQNTIGLTYTDKVDGSHSNRVAALDGRFVFADIYSLTWQTGGSFTRDGGKTVSAPMWNLVANASGKKYGASFSMSGYHGDFNAESGFINRTGIVHANFSPTRRWDGTEGSFLESFTVGVTLDGTWDYDRFTRGTGPNDRKLHFNTGYSFRGGFTGSTSIFYESFMYPEDLYTNYFIERHENGVPVDTVAYSNPGRLTNLGFWSRLNTPRIHGFSASVFIVAGRDDNFFEWSHANIYFVDLTLNYNPTEQLRFNLLYNHQQYDRASDRSTVGLRRVPRLKVEYQVTPSIFVRVVGQYDSRFTDALRDDSRTDDPILILDESTGTFSRTTARRSNNIQVDWLFSYRPTPGTVLFFGYGSSLVEPETYRLRNLQRLGDGFFIKLSYLFRVE